MCDVRRLSDAHDNPSEISLARAGAAHTQGGANKPLKADNRTSLRAIAKRNNMQIVLGCAAQAPSVQPNHTLMA